MAAGAFVEHPAEERIGLEGVGLVDAGEQAAAAARLTPLGQAEREIEQPLAGVARDHSVSRASLSVTTPLPMEANRPSVDSRITTRSMPRSAAPTIGLGMSGMSRHGRTPA